MSNQIYNKQVKIERRKYLFRSTYCHVPKLLRYNPLTQRPKLDS